MFLNLNETVARTSSPTRLIPPRRFARIFDNSFENAFKASERMNCLSRLESFPPTLVLLPLELFSRSRSFMYFSRSFSHLRSDFAICEFVCVVFWWSSWIVFDFKSSNSLQSSSHSRVSSSIEESESPRIDAEISSSSSSSSAIIEKPPLRFVVVSSVVEDRA